MKKLVVTSSARRDLQRIYAYIAREDKRVATAFLKDLTEKLAWIAEADFSGSPRDHVSEGLKAFPYRNRCIYFRTNPAQITFIRVLHQSQDVDKEFGR